MTEIKQFYKCKSLYDCTLKYRGEDETLDAELPDDACWDNQKAFAEFDWAPRTSSGHLQIGTIITRETIAVCRQSR